MTATERLRQLLDERGVEHIDYEGSATWWSNGSVECAYIQSISDGFGQLGFIATPEQAVEATLGSDEVADLRQALADLWPRASFTMCPENRESWLERLAELGVEVES